MRHYRNEAPSDRRSCIGGEPLNDELDLDGIATQNSTTVARLVDLTALWHQQRCRDAKRLTSSII
uniref:Uncharacterized protein n=1 Tax=Cucumis melo TaxID=3656 RepID=A0A9I9D1L1_CUCME